MKPGRLFDTSSTFFYPDRDEYGGAVVPRLPGVGGSVRVVMSVRPGRFHAVAPWGRFLGRLSAAIVILIGVVGSYPAAARHGHAAARQAAEGGPVFEWILLDAETGQVLSEQNADVLTYPASLTK